MAEYASTAESRGLERDHRRRGRRRAPARHDRVSDRAAGARRAGGEPRAARPRFAPLDRADAGRRAGRARFAIGKAGATNAALSPFRPGRGRAEAARRSSPLPGRPDAPGPEGEALNPYPSRRHARRARQRPARPHVRDRRAADGLSRPHVFPRRRHADRPGRRRRGRPRRTTTSTRVRAFARDVDVVTFEFENVPGAAARAAEAIAPVRPCPAVLHTAQHRAAREDVPSPSAAFPSRTSTRRDARGALRRRGRASARRHAQDRRLRLRRQGPARDRHDRPMPRTRGTALGEPKRSSRHSSTSRRRSRWSRARGSTGGSAHFGRSRTGTATTSSTCSMAPANVAPALAAQAVEIARGGPRARCGRRRAVRRVLRHHATGELLVNELAPRPHNSGHLTVRRRA